MALGLVALLRVGMEGFGGEAGREKASSPLLRIAPTAGNFGGCVFPVCTDKVACANRLLMNPLYISAAFLHGKQLPCEQGMHQNRVLDSLSASSWD